MSDFDVVGDVLGDDDDIVGEVLGMDTMGAIAKRPRLLAVPKRPNWRRAVAPGVAPPGQGLEPMPLSDDSGAGGVFTAAVGTLNFVARPQRPFRAERLLATVRRTGGTAAGGIVQMNPGIFIGTQLQSLEIGGMDIEFFSATAFGVRLQLAAATPGMLIRVPLILFAGALAGADTIAVSMAFLGRSIR